MARPTDYARLASKAGYLGKVFKVINGRAGTRYADDSALRHKPVSHTSQDLADIRGHLWTAVTDRYMDDSIDFVSPDDLLENMMKPSEFRVLFTLNPVSDAAGKSVQDAFFNPFTGIGTSNDPGNFNFARAPVLMSPMEASAFYSNGGIPQIIIDKKAKGILLNGYGFEGEGWSVDECKRLHEGAELLGYGEQMVNAKRDALVHGGSFMYPALKKDTALSTPQSIDELLRAGILSKDCIHHFAVADRWNTVLVPNWDLTADDYLYPRTIYVPIGGVEVATARAAVIRPRMLDYWGMIRQIGWTTSDFEGWIRPLLGYEIIIQAIPIMAQQMSLLVHVLPLDGAIAQDGIKAANEFIKANVNAMRAWSMANPVTINSYGELKAIERHYEGFNDLIGVSQNHVCASAGFPQSVIFPTQPKGLADSNEADVLLKQSETIKLQQESIKPQLSPVARIIAISVFGPNYKDAKGVGIMAKLPTLRTTFETPIVVTAEKQAEAGGKFTAMIRDLTGAEVPLDMAFETAKLFFPDVEIPATLMARIKQIGESDPRNVQAGMTEVSKRWGPDIVARLSQRMSEKRVADSGAPHRPVDGAEVKAVADKLSSLEATVKEGQVGWTRKLARGLGRILRSSKKAVEDAQGAGTISVQPHIEVKPPEVTVTMPPIQIDVHNEVQPAQGGSVSTFSYDLDDKGKIKPGTVKVTKVPINGNKK